MPESLSLAKFQTHFLRFASSFGGRMPESLGLAKFQTHFLRFPIVSYQYQTSFKPSFKLNCFGVSHFDLAFLKSNFDFSVIAIFYNVRSKCETPIQLSLKLGLKLI